MCYFPGGSADKESSCNVGDLGSIPGMGRSLEKGKATYSSILAWRIPWTEETGSPWGCKESDTTERLSLQPLWKRICFLVGRRHLQFHLYLRAEVSKLL